MTIKELQPIRFTDLPSSCKCNSVETIPVQSGDITQFQVELDVCEFMPNIAPNGDFDASDGWDYNGFAFTSDTVVSDDASDGVLETTSNIMGDDYNYQIELDVVSTTGQPLYVYFGKYKVAEITESGNYVLSGVCESRNGVGTLDKLRVLSPIGNTCVIERIACYMLESKYKLALLNVNGQIMYVFKEGGAQEGDGFYFFKKDRNTVTISFDWNIITHPAWLLGTYGCYQLGLIGSCENQCGQMGVIDPNFLIENYELSTSSFPWARTKGVNPPAVDDIADGVFTFLGSASVVASVNLTQDGLAACTSKSYEYNFTLVIDSISNAEIIVTWGGDTSATYTTSGTKTFTLQSSNTDGLNILIRDALAGIQGSAVISYFDFELATASQYTLDYTSNMFNFKEVHDCTVLVAGTNNEDAYGLNFESAMYTPRLRWKGSFRSLPTDSKVEHYIDALGNKKINFFDNKLRKELRLQEVPEYLANWLSMFEGFNKVWVNETEYVVSDNPDVSYNRFCDTAKVSIEMENKRQELTNINKRGVVAVTDYLNVLVRVFDEQEPIIFIDGDEIALKG